MVKRELVEGVLNGLDLVSRALALPKVGGLRESQVVLGAASFIDQLRQDYENVLKGLTSDEKKPAASKAKPRKKATASKAKRTSKKR